MTVLTGEQQLGGGSGVISAYLGTHFSSLRFVVQDLRSVIASHPQLPDHLAEDNRVSYLEHDFFTPQPVRNADIYFFRSIFRNWSDKYCVGILRNLIPALRPGARIVVHDRVLAEPGMFGSQFAEERMRYDSATRLDLSKCHQICFQC